MHSKSTKQRRSYHRRRTVVAPLEAARLKVEAEEKLRNYRASLALASMFGAPPTTPTYVHTATVHGRLSAKTGNAQTLPRKPTRH